MSKSVHDDVLDAALDKIATATRLDVCSSEPTTLTEATTTNSLANTALTAGDSNGDYAISNDTSGRKLTVGAQPALPITSTGSAQHIALSDGTNLLYVTTCATRELSSGGTVDVPARDINLQDPS